MVHGQPSEGYNKLDLSFADVSDVEGCDTTEDSGCEIEGEEEGGKELEEGRALPSTSTPGKNACEPGVTDVKGCETRERATNLKKRTKTKRKMIQKKRLYYYRQVLQKEVVYVDLLKKLGFM